MKEQFKELVGLLRQSEARRKEVEKELKLREQAVAVALATAASVRLCHFIKASSHASHNTFRTHRGLHRTSWSHILKQACK